MIIFSIIAFILALLTCAHVLKPLYHIYSLDKYNPHRENTYKVMSMKGDNRRKLVENQWQLQLMYKKEEQQREVIKTLEHMCEEKIKTRKQEIEYLYEKQLKIKEKQMKAHKISKLFDENITIFLKEYKGQKDKVLQNKIEDFFLKLNDDTI